LLDDPSRFFEVAVAESFLPFPAVVARIMVCGQLLVDGFIQFDFSRFDILFQEIMD
jgi:hypothetical protein